MVSKYYIVSFDDHRGNLGRESELIYFLKKNGFRCLGGFWGCPWYFINIEDKLFYPGRPGVSYGKAIRNNFISFDEFKTIYSSIVITNKA